MKLSLGQIADLIHATGEIDRTSVVQGFSIDADTIAEGELFFPVRGESTNGHELVEAALVNGATAAVVSRRWLAPPNVDKCKLLRVPDEEGDCVLGSMHKLARAVRRQWGRRVIGITGSVGKTTTKECVAEVLSAQFRVLKTEGNLNNHLGVPLQLLRLEPEHEVAVIEMGMNHASEISALCCVAEPDWGVISNVAPVHLEHFADGIDGIARAKQELVDALPLEGIAFLNGDDARVAKFGKDRGVYAMLYGTWDHCAVRAEEIEELGLAGTRFLVKAGELQHPVLLRLIGRHNILNALAAVAVGLASGVSLSLCCEALQKLRPIDRRGTLLERSGAQLINDCYNSNPHALNAMVIALANSTAVRRILVAGEMLELGSEAPALHAECGRKAALAGIDLVIGVRGLARQIARAAAQNGVKALYVDTPEEAGAWLLGNLREGDVVLIKGSRGVGLERALDVVHEPQPPLAAL